MLTPNQGFTYNKFEAPSDWPRIDKTFDYKIENDKLLSGNEHIYLYGPVGYTKVGSPTITDGIASGFSSSNYLSISSQLDTTKPFEIVAKFKTTSIGAIQGIIGYRYNGMLHLFIRANGEIRFAVGTVPTSFDIGQISGITLSANTDYMAKAVFTGTKYELYLSTDNGLTWSLQGSITSSVKVNNGTPVELRIGRTHSQGWVLTGSIDLNHTYIKVNGKLWFYGKNYATKNMVPVPAGLEYNNTVTTSIGWVNTNTDKIEGPINYTITGSPTIVDNVVSGFSQNNYLKLETYIPSGDFELQIGFTLPDTIVANSYVLEFPSMFSLGFNSGNTSYMVGWDWGSSSFKTIIPSNSVSGGSSYLVKFTRTSDDITTSWSKDGSAFSTPQLYSSNVSQTSYGVLGNAVTGSEQRYFRGLINLNSTYISVNGHPWFGKCPSEFQQFISVSEGIMIGKDETEMLKVETYQEKGIVDYTITGNLTIQNDVVSNFSSSNYLTLPNWTDEGQNLEFCLSFLLPEPYVPGSRPMNQISSGGTWSSYFSIDSYQGGLSYRIKSGESLSIVYSLQNETKYIAKLVRQSGTYTLYLLDEQENILATSTSLQTSTLIGNGYSSLMRIGYESSVYGNEFPGKIYLDKTYIKINSVYLFKPCPNSYPKLVGPVSYTTVGSPTIVNGVASGFSSSDYLSVPAIDFGSSDFEMKIAFIPYSIQSSVRIFANGGGASGLFGFQNQAGVVRANIQLDGVRNYVDSSIPLVANTKYYAILKKTLTKFSVSVSTDNINYTTNEISISGTSCTVPDILKIGGVTSTVFDGSVDLNETYIKVNGSLWFGKEDWKPCIYTDNAIYLLGSHSADYSNYNQLSFTPSIETESDEAGSYNVWIDNQKVIENKTGNTLIEWDKLALTTGYSVTTPSSLKAHPIKIEPTNSTDSIIAFNTETIEESDESI